MKKIIIFAVCALFSVYLFAGPHHGPGPSSHRAPTPSFRPAPHRHHSHSSWGHGGSNFWPGFVGGIIGGTIVNSQPLPPPPPPPTPIIVRPTPIVTIPQPVVVQQPILIWVAGRYIDQVQPNGTIIRIWQPGHYETR